MSSAKSGNFVGAIQAFVGLVIGLIEIILVFRFILRLLGASPQAEIVSWVLVNSAPFLRPFAFAFTPLVFPGGFIIEFSTLLAIFAYGLIWYVLKEVLNMLR